MGIPEGVQTKLRVETLTAFKKKVLFDKYRSNMSAITQTNIYI